MLIVRSHGGVPIRLTGEWWHHIVRRHPELSDQRERILETIASPELIQEGDFGALLAVQFYPDTPLTSKFLVAAYREIGDDGFLITAYFTRRPAMWRTVLWKR